MHLKNGVGVLPVNLIRTIAIVFVILLHASTQPYTDIELMSTQGVQIWWASNVYNSLSRVCIPLFVMLTGALLLQPSKADEPIKVFFKKRWTRLGVPVIFWAFVYFVWASIVNGKILPFDNSLLALLTGPGPYYHFWYLYLLFGMYLLTPVLSIILKYADKHILRYTFVLWFLGTAVVPLLTLFGQFYLNENFFIFTGWIGYFVIGAYLTRVQIKPSFLITGLVGGLLWTIIGTYLVIGSLGESYSQFFYDGFSINMIIASTALFLLLLSIPSNLQKSMEKNCLIQLVSANTLPIYLFHVIVLESLQNGYFGFTLKISSMNPFIAIPLSATLTFFISLAVILPLKKIPYVNKIIG